MSYVLIGALARVIRGTNELTDGVDVCPSLTDFNRERLGERSMIWKRSGPTGAASSWRTRSRMSG